MKNIERSVRAYHSRLKEGAVLPPPAPCAPTAQPAPARTRQRPTAIVAAAAAVGALIVALVWLKPWEARQRADGDAAQAPPAAAAPATPAASAGTGVVAAPATPAASDKFLSESEIRQAIVGNTLNFRSPRTGVNLFVYLHEDGSVVVKGEHAREPVTMHTWFFKQGDIFCRTVQLDMRQHCTRVAVGDDAGTLNFINAKNSVFYQAKVLKGMQVPN